MRRAFPTGCALALILALVLSGFPQSSPALTTGGDSDVPITLEQCRDQLLSGGFGVVELNKDHRFLPGIPRQFAKTIDEIIEKKGTKDSERAKDRFDRARANLLERIIDGRWGMMNESSDDILTDCFFAVHPEADVEN